MTGAGGHLALFVPVFDNGGVERMLLNLARGFVEAGLAVDLVIGSAKGAAYLDGRAPGVGLVELGDGSEREWLRRFVAYLETQRPDIVLSAKRESDLLAVRARQRSRHRFRLYIRAVVDLGQLLAHRNALYRWWSVRTLRRHYRQVDGIIAVSQGVADDLAATCAVPRALLHVAPNPVLTPEMAQWAACAVDDPWLVSATEPVIVGSGRLGRQKNFALLIRAFARLRAQRPARLLILGGGRQRERLRRLAVELGVGDAVRLCGFVTNPYAYLRRADLFVLSSLWEGSPNVLTEALSLGTRVVATDCPSGPREILDDGRFGRLVPLDDPQALAEAMGAALDGPPPDPQALRAWVARYDYRYSARCYLEAMGVDVPG